MVPPRAMSIPTNIGGYAIAGVCGHGGMGVVLRARSPDGREVAIKLVRGDHSREALDRFRRECRLVWTFSEADGFVPVIDAGETPAGPYLVMPFLPGGTLRDRLRRGPLAPEEASRIVAIVAAAVGRAHERGIVHRDLKPENILFASDGRPLVADLGVAKHFRRDVLGASKSAHLSGEGGPIGTPGYMAREQVLDGRDATPASDVFSLGAILYECVTGLMPFPGGTVVEVFARMESGTLEPMSASARGSPAWLEPVVERALRPDPDERFPDAAAFARALAQPAPAPRHPRKAYWIFVVTAIIGGASAAASLRYWSPRPSEETRKTAPVRPPDEDVASMASRIIVELERRSSYGADTKEEPVAFARWRIAVLAELDREVAAEPRAPELRIARARVRWRHGDRDGAFADVEIALEIAPDSPEARTFRGGFRIDHGLVAAGLADLDLALTTYPSNLRARLFRSIGRERVGDHRGALEDLDHLLEVDRLDPKALDARRAIRTKTGDVAGALLDARLLTEVCPEQGTAWLDRAMTERLAGELSSALASASRSLELSPQGTTLRFRAEVFRALGDLDRALGDLDRAVALDPLGVDNWLARGALHLQREDPEKALADYSQAIGLQPRNGRSRFNRAVVHERRGDRAAARKDYDDAIQLAPDWPTAWFGRGTLREREGDHSGAAADLTRCLALSPDMVGALRNRALVLESLGELDAAIIDATRAVSLDPSASSFVLRARLREEEPS